MEEYALGQDPTVSGGLAYDFDLKDLIVSSQNATYLTIDFRFRLNAGVTVTPLGSSDLVNWSPLVNQYSGPINNGDGFQSVFYRDDSSTDEAPKRYIRLQVTED